MKRLAWSIWVPAMLLAACASPPPRETPAVDVDMPAAWSAAAEHPPTTDTLSTRWWSEFGDETLSTLVDEALAYNYDLQAASARVDQAAALARLAGADLYPQVGLGFDAARRRQNFIGFPIPGQASVITTRATTVGVSLDVAWEIDLWGRVRSGQAAALADLQASWADLAGLRLSLAAQTVKTYFALIEARLQVELAEETVESFRSSANRVRHRYEQGVRSALDLRLALANEYSAEALLEFRRQQYDRVRRQLEILLGRYPAGTVAAEGDLPDVTSEVPAGLPSELLLRRPDLLAAERRFAAAEKRVSASRRAFFPRLLLTGSSGTLAADLEDLVDGDFGVWSIAAGVTQPLFQGGRLRANLAQSEAVSDQTLAIYVLDLLRAFGEVEHAIFADEALVRRVDRTRLAAEQSEAAQRLAERQYDAGLVDYITVLEAQRRALTARSELLVARRERLDARVNLSLALGGGFDAGAEWMEFLQAQATRPTEDDGE